MGSAGTTRFHGPSLRARRRIYGVGSVLVAVLAAAAFGFFPRHVESEKSKSPLKTDLVSLAEGDKVWCRLIEVTDEKVVYLEGLRRRTKDRDEVDEIERDVGDEVVEIVRRIETAIEDEDADVLRSIASVCRRREEKSGQNWTPERRRALRALDELDPDRKSRAQLRDVLYYEGAWFSLADLKEMKLVKGKLRPRERKSSKEGRAKKKRKTAVKPKLFATYKPLEGESVSKIRLKRISDMHAKRLENAEAASEIHDFVDGVEWEDRIVHQTRHFEIHCNASMKLTKRYGRMMELIRAKLADMFKSPIKRNTRTPVFIFKTQEEFMEALGIDQWEAGWGLGGFYSSQPPMIATFHGTFGFTGTTFGTLAHEGTHYYQDLVLKNMMSAPSWLIEGLAVYFGDGARFDAEKQKITIGKIPRDRLTTIQEKIRKKRHEKIGKLVSLSRRQFRGDHYADSWALIYYLVNTGSKGTKLMRAYWDIARVRRPKKSDFVALANRYFGSLEELEKGYLEYISSIEPPPAGEIMGDYYISEPFRFMLKRPSERWSFFTDSEDERMLLGLALPDYEAEIRIYFFNNYKKSDADDFIKVQVNHYRRMKYKKVKLVETKVGNLDGFRIRYSRPVRFPLYVKPKPAEDAADSEKEAASGKAAENRLLAEGDSDSKPKKRKKRKKKRTKKKNYVEVEQEFVDYFLVQLDGVAVIRCLANPGETKKFRDDFEAVKDSFALDTTRRW